MFCRGGQSCSAHWGLKPTAGAPHDPSPAPHSQRCIPAYRRTNIRALRLRLEPPCLKCDVGTWALIFFFFFFWTKVNNPTTPPSLKPSLFFPVWPFVLLQDATLTLFAILNWDPPPPLFYFFIFWGWRIPRVSARPEAVLAFRITRTRLLHLSKHAPQAWCPSDPLSVLRHDECWKGGPLARRVFHINGCYAGD